MKVSRIYELVRLVGRARVTGAVNDGRDALQRIPGGVSSARCTADLGLLSAEFQGRFPERPRQCIVLWRGKRWKEQRRRERRVKAGTLSGQSVEEFPDVLLGTLQCFARQNAAIQR